MKETIIHKKFPSVDTIYERLYKSLNSENINSLIEDSVGIRKSIRMFNRRVNLSIDRQDDPYCGMDSQHLINVKRNKMRGTNKVARIAYFICTKR